MAQLKDTVVSGSLRATDTIYTNKIQTSIIGAPTSSNGATFGVGTNGQVLKSNGTSVYWSSDSAGVTSVRVQATSPVTSSVNTAQTGSLDTTIALANNYGDTKNPYASKTKNTVLAAPATADGVPLFRALVADDIPTISPGKASLGNVSNNANLNKVSGAKGDIIYWSATDTPAHLTNTSSTVKHFLSITSQVPSWSTVTKGDVGLGYVENTALSTWGGSSNIKTVGTITTGTWQGTAIAASYIGSHSTDKLTSGTLGIARGGTGKATIAAYSMWYASAKDTLAEITANTSNTKKFLRMTGTGSAGAAPAWDTVTKGDVGLGNVENTALSTWAGTNKITTVGTIGTGTWQGTAVALDHGGTGATSASAARTNLGLGTAATYNITGGNEGYSTSVTLIPRIGTDGVMEVGKYIDFHASTGTSKDYDVRITAATTGLTISGTTSGTFSGSLAGNATNVTGTVTVSHGGTGATSFTANSVIMSGSTTTAALTTKAITDNSSNADVTSSDTNLITGRTLYYQLAKKEYLQYVMQDGVTGIVSNTNTGIIKQIGSRYATCSNSEASPSKGANLIYGIFSLEVGATVRVKFTDSNTATNPTLNINNTGAKPIYKFGTTRPGTTPEDSWSAGEVVTFVYDGAGWQMSSNPIMGLTTAQENALLALIT